MTQATPKKKFPVALTALLVAVLGVGGGIVYLVNTEKVPSWLSFIYGSAPSDADAGKASSPQSPLSGGEQSAAAPAGPDASYRGELVPPPSSPPAPSDPWALSGVGTPGAREPGDPALLPGQEQAGSPGTQEAPFDPTAVPDSVPPAGSEDGLAGWSPDNYLVPAGPDQAPGQMTEQAPGQMTDQAPGLAGQGPTGDSEATPIPDFDPVPDEGGPLAVSPPPAQEQAGQTPPAQGVQGGVKSAPTVPADQEAQAPPAQSPLRPIPGIQSPPPSQATPGGKQPSASVRSPLAMLPDPRKPLAEYPASRAPEARKPEARVPDIRPVQSPQPLAMPPHSPGPETPIPDFDPVPSPDGSSGAAAPSVPAPSESSVILYGKGEMVASANGAMVRGEIPEDQTPISLSGSYRGNPDFTGSTEALKGQDSLVSVVLVDDFAKFLADNYWPQGTHPMAKKGGITTAGVKWANLRFGGQLHGFTVNAMNLPEERQRVLEYVFMPSMLQGLYDLYIDRFMYSLERHALAQIRGQDDGGFTNAQMAEMYELYSGMARGLAATVRTYMHTPDIREFVVSYAEASDQAAAAYVLYAENLHSEDPSPEAKERQAATAKDYQAAVAHREKRRAALAEAMRARGDTKGIDTDTLVYTALWLYRRGEGQDGTINALAAILGSCSDRLEKGKQRYKGKAPSQLAEKTAPRRK
ncbi:hypothetical protein LJC59_04255 [Desulfovibrio sp. OttesenSCG-928-A18]|nr:hypothetical protein [Desulfovibrio sp. OttesenSCG-928-A18]